MPGAKRDEVELDRGDRVRDATTAGLVAEADERVTLMGRRLAAPTFLLSIVSHTECRFSVIAYSSGSIPAVEIR